MAESTELTLIERADRASFTAGAVPKALVPTTFDAVWTLSEMIVAANMAPKDFDAPKCTVAIMHGLEVGLLPMQALQSIAVVNGRPTIWGDGALGLVRGSGYCEWVKETLDGDGDDMAAICTVKRKGDPKPVTQRFSVSDAKKAALWTKSGPWSQYPKRMLQMRARAFALRDAFADVLKGLSVREEVEDYEMVDVTPKRGRGGRAPTMAEDNPLNDEAATDAKATEKPVEGDKPAAATSKPTKAKKAATAPETAAAAVSDRVYPLDQFVKDCGEAKTLDELDAVRDRSTALLAALTGENKARAVAAVDAAEDRIEAANRAWEESNGKADQGEEPEEGEGQLDAGSALVSVAQQQEREGRSRVADVGEPRSDTGAGISSGETREAPENAGNNASVGSAGGTGIPAGNWTDKESKWLTNVATKFAAATDAKSALAAEQFWQPQIHLKSDAVQAAFREMATAAKARFMGGRG